MTVRTLKRLGGALALAALYGVLNYVTLGWSLPGASVAVSIRPQIVIPLLAGFMLGPLAGFIAGGLGNLLGDWLCGWGVGYWPFSLGNGLMGALMGLLGCSGLRRIESVGGFAQLLLTLAGGNALSIGLGLATYNLLVPDTLQQLTWSFFHPIVVSNILMSFLFVPPLLFLMKRLSATFDVRLCASMFYLLILVVMPLIYAVNATDYRGLREGMAAYLAPEEVVAQMERIALADFRVGGSLGIAALLASLAAAFFLVQYVSRPVRALLRAATQLKEGRLDQIHLEGLVRKNDELGRLAQVFEEAVARVREREESLQRAIQKLQVEINREQEATEVSQITETDYFRSLRRKSLELRARKNKVKP